MDKTQLRAIRDALNDLRNQADIVKAILDNVEPDPPKPVGVIAVPGMLLVDNNGKRCHVITRKMFTRMSVYHTESLPDGTIPCSWGGAEYPKYAEYGYFKTPDGDPITGYEDD